MFKGFSGFILDLTKIGLCGLVIVIGINYFSSKNNLVTIKSCYDGDSSTTNNGEKIRLACIDTPELRRSKADPVPAKAARDYLNTLVAGQEVSIRRITKDRYGRTVAEISKGRMNIQKRLVGKGYAKIYQRYADQCKWSRK